MTKTRPRNHIDRNAEGQDHFSAIAHRLISRRRFMLSALAGGTVAALGSCAPGSISAIKPADHSNALPVGVESSLGFPELAHGLGQDHHVADGYTAEVLARWGDPIFAGGPAFSPRQQSKGDQLQQFGDNCDYIAYLPLADDHSANAWQHFNSRNSSHGLLCVNHEHTRLHMMFDTPAGGNPGASVSEIGADMAAHGHSLLEIRRIDDSWQVVLNGNLNRRISAFTPMRISGPAAGHPRLRTREDPKADRIIGTFANCGGGVTPWGTVLTAEENFRKFFNGSPEKIRASHPREALMHERFDIRHSEHHWHTLYDRYDIEKEPHEPNRFGWVVEINPYDSTSTPIKRTALGRFQHEAATVVAKDQQPVAVYSGDDSPNEYLYRFVSSGRYQAQEREANLELLDQGTLYVARFADDGTGEWLPLVHGTKGLTTQDGFASQADILIDARLAADAVGATRMDRPEDVETNPLNDRVYVSLTKNDEREAVDAANPRLINPYGHMLEISPPGTDGDRDHLATHFTWNIFLMGGRPGNNAESDTKHTIHGSYGDNISPNGWFCNPDNIAFDPQGRIWVATDGFNDFGVHDGLWAADTVGDARATPKHFFGCPIGAELCGPCFSPDGKSLFVAVQHPGDFGDASFANPATRWPDFNDDLPPRASVVAITKQDGGEIGS